MDFGSVSAAISVCRDHNDDNIMKRRRRWKRRRRPKERRGGNDDATIWGKIVIVVRRGGTIKSTANQEQIEPPRHNQTRRDGDQIGGMVSLP